VTRPLRVEMEGGLLHVTSLNEGQVPLTQPPPQGGRGLRNRSQIITLDCATSREEGIVSITLTAGGGDRGKLEI
jgi:hypothetical protein